MNNESEWIKNIPGNYVYVYLAASFLQDLSAYLDWDLLQNPYLNTIAVI